MEMECPYCHHEYDLNHDDGAFYDESDSTEEECPACEKKFLVWGSCHWNWEPTIAECLNDGNHTWQKRYNPKHYPDLIRKEECRYCGERRTLPKEEP